MSATLSLAITASAETLDRRQVSELIAETGRESDGLLPETHIHILDPADYLRHRSSDHFPTLDLSTMTRRIESELPRPLDMLTSIRLIRAVGFVLLNDEMAVTLHTLPQGGTLCVIIPRSAPLGLADIASKLSGLDEKEFSQARAVSVTDLYRFLLYHELAHCAERSPPYRSKSFSAYDAYRTEARADAFAVLMHVRSTGEDSVPRFLAHLRRQGAKHRDDIEHQTAAIVESTLAFSMDLLSTGLFRDRTASDLLFAAQTFVETHSIGRKAFRALYDP